MNNNEKNILEVYDRNKWLKKYIDPDAVPKVLTLQEEKKLKRKIEQNEEMLRPFMLSVKEPSISIIYDGEMQEVDTVEPKWLFDEFDYHFDTTENIQIPVPTEEVDNQFDMVLWLDTHRQPIEDYTEKQKHIEPEYLFNMFDDKFSLEV